MDKGCRGSEERCQQVVSRPCSQCERSVNASPTGSRCGHTSVSVATSLRRVRRSLVSAAVIFLLLAPSVACSGGDAEVAGPTPVVTATSAPVTSTVAPAADAPMSTGLTESPRTASTIERPNTPPSCDPGDVTIWTARTEITSGSASAVIRVRNDGSIRCEVDIASSERVDRFIEPNVWLEPGDGADLVVGDNGLGCSSPRRVLEVELVINESSRTVPTSAVVPCDWMLAAFYPAETPAVPCEPAALDMVRVDDEIVIRNGSVAGCVLGEVVAVDGAGLAPPADGDRPIDWLAGGDVVALPVGSDAPDCDRMELVVRFTSGAIVVEGSTCDVIGAATAYYDGERGPLGSFGPGDDVDDVIAALDPFTSPVG